MPSKEKDDTIAIFEYHYSPDYKSIYATGARGGIQNGYHLHIDFYNEKTRLSTKQRLIPKTDREGKIEDIDPINPPVIDREFLVGIDFSFGAAKQLSKWLIERVAELEMLEEQSLDSITNGETQ